MQSSSWSAQSQCVTNNQNAKWNYFHGSANAGKCLIFTSTNTAALMWKLANLISNIAGSACTTKKKQPFNKKRSQVPLTSICGKVQNGLWDVSFIQGMAVIWREQCDLLCATYLRANIM